jgi:hypothetical protein
LSIHGSTWETSSRDGGVIGYQKVSEKLKGTLSGDERDKYVEQMRRRAEKMQQMGDEL